MNSFNKIIVCFTIVTSLFIGAISTSALSNTVKNESNEQNTTVNPNEKEERLKTLLMEEICNVQDNDIPKIRDDEYKKALTEKFINIVKEKSYDTNEQFIVDNFIKIWPEIFLSDNTENTHETKNSNNGRWLLMYNLLMNWPKDLKVNNALLAEIEDYKLIEKVKKEPSQSYVTRREEAIRKNMEEKQKLIDEAKFQSLATEDIPPTEESIRESMEEKKRLVEEFEKKLLNSCN